MNHSDLWATLAAASALWVTLRKAIAMLKIVKQILSAVLLVVVAVELETEGQGQGADKKAAAQAKLQDVLDPVLPDWANPLVFSGAGWLIDVLVGYANKTGFFGQFADVLSS